MRIFTDDLADPMVNQFVNAGDDLLPFMSQCSAGDVKKPSTLAPDMSRIVHVDWSRGMQLVLRKYLIDAGGPNPIDAFIRAQPDRSSP